MKKYTIEQEKRIRELYIKGKTEHIKKLESDVEDDLIYALIDFISEESKRAIISEVNNRLYILGRDNQLISGLYINSDASNLRGVLPIIINHTNDVYLFMRAYIISKYMVLNIDEYDFYLKMNPCEYLDMKRSSMTMIKADNLFNKVDSLINTVMNTYDSSGVSCEFSNIFIRKFNDNFSYKDAINFILVNRYSIKDIDNLVLGKCNVGYNIYIAHEVNSLETLSSIPCQSDMYGRDSYFIIGSIPRTLENGVQLLMSESAKRNMFIITDQKI